MDLFLDIMILQFEKLEHPFKSESKKLDYMLTYYLFQVL